MMESALPALREAAIAREPDRYFAATLAPPSVRYDLVALAAFAAELANIPAQVREPLAGEIRLQWWRDALFDETPQAAGGHPVAMAVRASMARFTLPSGLIEGLIDSYVDVLHGERPADAEALSARLASREGALFELAARVCTVERPGLSELAARAGTAYGLSRALRQFSDPASAEHLLPQNVIGEAVLAAAPAAQSQLREAARSLLESLARSAMDDIRPQFSNMLRHERLPLLPLAMVRPNLQALHNQTTQGSAVPHEPLPVGRLLRITWAYLSGRL